MQNDVQRVQKHYFKGIKDKFGDMQVVHLPHCPPGVSVSATCFCDDCTYLNETENIRAFGLKGITYRSAGPKIALNIISEIGPGAAY